MSDNIIQLNQELIHNEFKDLVRNSVEETLNAMLDHEADDSLMPRNMNAQVSVKDIALVITAVTFRLHPAR